MKRTFFLFAVILLVAGCHQSNPKNPYNLPIAVTMEDYLAQVAENPNTELVDLEEVIPGISLDIAYAKSENFTGIPIYTSPKAFLCRPVALALALAQDSLKKLGMGFEILDAYRPYAATLYFYEVYHDTTFVASPHTGSIHNRGAAVDLTLICLETGEELEMPTRFDSFSDTASHAFNDLPEHVLKNRATLRGIMEAYGFSIYEPEWWHYNYKNARSYPLRDVSFEELMNR
ncbi:MAG: M15 family metallopeptidase [Bacteroidales bacterium]|jgi:D-alanyl-D-alanine dipeptidase